MVDKPRVRVQASSTPVPQEALDAARALTADGFVNTVARQGLQGGNLSGYGTYAPNYITRNWRLLEQAYRGSWIVGAAVDHAAEDMTRGGLDYVGMPGQSDVDLMTAAHNDLMLSSQMCSNIKWGRLYGGSIAIMMIDGQDTATPLQLDSVRKGSFKGLLVLDRTVLNPSVGDLDIEMGPNFGLPKFYTVMAQPGGLPAMKIHASRVVRSIGIEMPFYQRWTENLWGSSVIERIFDRLVTFDSATAGAANLVFKAHLRTIKIKGLRNIISAGGAMRTGLETFMQSIREFQSSEGLTLLDGDDDFQVDAYTFSGLDKILEAFGDQICGCIEEPRTRLFGQSPGGLNSTGESDLTTYYDNILKRQELSLRRPWTIILDVLYRSVFGASPPEGFGFKFRPLWQMSAKEKADTGAAVGTAVVNAYDKGVIPRATALKELKNANEETGMWGAITDEDVADAEAEPPLSEMVQTPEDEAAAAQAATEHAASLNAPGDDPEQPGDA